MSFDKNQKPSRRNLPGEVVGRARPDRQRRTEDFFWRYVPKGMLGKLGADNIRDVDAGQNVECKVAVVFMDVRNFTEMSENLSAEETFVTINALLGLAIPIIHEHGGIIDKFIGDAIMAIFPDESDGAVLAVNEILGKIPGLSLPASVVGELSVGAGINSGFVILGALGNYERMDITVIGDAVNLASRLESLNKSYKTSFLISESTLYALDKPQQFNARMIDRIRVKGKIRPQSVYEIFDAYPQTKRQAIIDTSYEFGNALAHYHLSHVKTAHELFKQVIVKSPEDEVAQLYLDRCERYLGGEDFDGLAEPQHTVPWESQYMLHIHDVDIQHHQLLDNINAVSRLVWEESDEDISEVLDKLQNYAIEHFETEARLMDQYDYPQALEHTREHNSFVQQFINVRREIESGKHDKLYMLFKIDVFLMDWLLNHTTGTDKHWADYIIAHGYEAS